MTEVLPEDFAGMIALRQELFIEEAVTSGVPLTNAEAHVQNWGDDISLRNLNQTWGMWLENPNDYRMRLVWRGEEMVGVYTAERIHPEFQTAKHLMAIQLAPDIRGRGVGSMILKDFIDWHAGLDARLEVFSGNKPAKAFYARLGFTDTGIEKDIQIGGHSTTLQMLTRKAGEVS